MERAAAGRQGLVERAAAAANPTDSASVAKLHAALWKRDPWSAQAAITLALIQMGETDAGALDRGQSRNLGTLATARRWQEKRIPSDPAGWFDVLTRAVALRTEADRVADRWRGVATGVAAAVAQEERYEKSAADTLPTKRSHVWMYHGTSDRFLPQIRTQGITAGHAPSNFGSKSRPDKRQTWVFLTLDPGHSPGGAADYARRAASRVGGDPIVLRVRVPVSRLYADTDDSDLSVARVQRRIAEVFPGEIMEIGGVRTPAGEDLFHLPDRGS